MSLGERENTKELFEGGKPEQKKVSRRDFLKKGVSILGGGMSGLSKIEGSEEGKIPEPPENFERPRRK